MKQKLNFRALLTLVAVFFVSVSALAQNITVKGHVKDNTGEDVISATVVQKGTSNGCVTDLNGNFTLSVPRGATLVVSFVGYTSQEVKAAQNLQIILQEDSKLLNEQVVIGYGTVKKNDMTGSVIAIKPDDMNKGLQTSAQDMIQGKIAGVSVITNSGEPGSGATIRIRGGSSLNASNDPLYVIDGLAMDSYGIEGSPNPLSLINPADIESFTVLKDASATAIYGSRASNGVIIITTKKGQKNSGPKVSYNGNVSVSTNINKMDVMNAAEYMSFVQKLSGYANDQAGWLASPEYANLGYYDANGNHLFADTDWQKEIYRTAVSTDHNITVSGGVKDLPYRVSFGYTNQSGVVKTSNYNRYTASVNLSPTFFDEHLKVNFNAKAMFSQSRYANTGTAVGNANSMDPTKPVYGNEKDYGGYWQWPTTVDWGDSEFTHGVGSTAPSNPVAAIYNYDNRGKSRALVGNIELDYKIHGFEDLHLHVNGGMDLSHGKSNKNQSPYTYDSGVMYFGSYGWNIKDTYNLSLNAYAQYIKELNEDNHFDVMAGYEWQHFNIETDYDYPVYYPNTHLANPGQLYSQSENTLYKSENYLVSFFGRANYSLMNRYLFTFTLRDDGSSRFHKNNRWGLFPSAAIAWKINEEAFLQNVDAINDLKLRLGWGITGQQEGIGDYTYFASYTPNSQGAYYPVIGNGVTYRPNAFNSNLTWEKTTTYNAGIDLGIANNRFTASLDYYYRKTTDLINTVYVAAGSNFDSKVTSNVGSLHNTGVEAQIVYRPIQTKDWRWEIGLNGAWNKNRIDELIASQGDDYYVPYGGLAVGGGTGNIKAWKKGQAASAFYVYQQVYDKAGQPIEGEFVDRNANGILDDGDKYFYKKADADVILGLSSKLIYKNWDFSFSLRASLNNYMYNAVEAGNSNLSYSNVYTGGYWHNVMKYQLDKNWQYIDASDAASDYFIQNASFLKCDNITLGYSFNHIGNSGIAGRLFLTAQNVFTITKYKGLDPEISGGYDGNIYPRPFTGIVGVSLNF